MNVRAYLVDTDEFFFPESNESADLAFFWSALAGYDEKGLDYHVSWGTGVRASDGSEIFVGDLLRITLGEERNKVLYPGSEEIGLVVQEDGCFVAVNDGGLYWDLSDRPEDDFEFTVEIIDRNYEQEI